ncbi:MAG: hypothetical protein WCT20_05180, partial [Candidatus Babeliales bacterium]
IIAQQGGTFNINGVDFDRTFGDPAKNKAKTLSLKFPNGTIVSCPQSKSLTLTAQDIANLSAPTVPNAFTHPSNALGPLTVFNEKWVFNSAGTGFVQFKAAAQQDINVTFASTPNVLDKNAYSFIIGGSNNTYSAIQKGVVGGDANQVVASKTLAKGADDGNVVTGGIPDDGTKVGDYWMRIRRDPNSQGTELGWGKGTDVGQDEKLVLIDKDPIASVKYVGFGGSSSAKYSGIKVDLGITLPEGFEDTPNAFTYPESSANKIATGSYNGELDAWMINDDGKLFRYNASSMDEDPWENQFPAGGTYATQFPNLNDTVTFTDIAVSSDGYALTTDMRGYVWLFDASKNNWTYLEAPGMESTKPQFDRVAIGNKSSMFAVQKTTNLLFKYVNGIWTPVTDEKGMQSTVIHISASFDGTIASIGTNGKVFFYSTNTNGKAVWTVEKYTDVATKASAPIILTKIGVGSADDIWGVNETATATEVWHKKDGLWTKLTGSGFTTISVNAAGTALAIDNTGNVHNFGTDGIAVDTTGIITEGGTLALASASYGFMDPQDSSRNKTVDVAKALSDQIGKSEQFKVPADMASYFGKNPAPNAQKKLSVKLTFNGYPLDEIIVNEGKEFVFTKKDALEKVGANTEDLKVFAAYFGAEDNQGPIKDKVIWITDKIKAMGNTITVPADMTAFFCKDGKGVITDPAPNDPKKLAIALLYHGQRIDLKADHGKAFTFTIADAKVKLGDTTATSTTYTYNPIVHNNKRCYFPGGKWSFASSAKAHARWIKFNANYTATDTVKPEINICFANNTNIDPATNLIKNNTSYAVTIGGSKTNPSRIYRGNADFGIATDSKNKKLTSATSITNLVTDETSTSAGGNYWAEMMASDNTFSWGTGNIVGKNTKQSWKDTSSSPISINRVTVAGSPTMNFTSISTGITNNATTTRADAIKSGTIKITKTAAVKKVATTVKKAVNTTLSTKKTTPVKTTIKKSTAVK